MEGEERVVKPGDPDFADVSQAYFGIDPGTRHLAGAGIIFYKDPERKPKVIYTRVRDVRDAGTIPDTAALWFFCEGVITELSDKLLENGTIPDWVTVIESQPPMFRGGPGMLRKNSFVEGYVHAKFVGSAPVHPCAYKRHFKIATGTYSVNKLLAVKRAKELVDNPEKVDSDHIADCVLMCIYYHTKKILPTKKVT